MSDIVGVCFGCYLVSFGFGGLSLVISVCLLLL